MLKRQQIDVSCTLCVCSMGAAILGAVKISVALNACGDQGRHFLGKVFVTDGGNYHPV